MSPFSLPNFGFIVAILAVLFLFRHSRNKAKETQKPPEPAKPSKVPEATMPGTYSSLPKRFAARGDYPASVCVVGGKVFIRNGDSECYTPGNVPWPVIAAMMAPHNRNVYAHIRNKMTPEQISANPAYQDWVAERVKWAADAGQP